MDLEIGNIDEGEFADGALKLITRLRDLAVQIVMAIEFLPEAVSLDWGKGEIRAKVITRPVLKTSLKY